MLSINSRIPMRSSVALAFVTFIHLSWSNLKTNACKCLFFASLLLGMNVMVSFSFASFDLGISVIVSFLLPIV